MAICTQCGNIIHEKDVQKHLCEVANLPTEGKEKKPTTSDKVLI